MNFYNNFQHLRNQNNNFVHSKSQDISGNLENNHKLSVENQQMSTNAFYNQPMFPQTLENMPNMQNFGNSFCKPLQNQATHFISPVPSLQVPLVTVHQQPNITPSMYHPQLLMFPSQPASSNRVMNAPFQNFPNTDSQRFPNQTPQRAEDNKWPIFDPSTRPPNMQNILPPITVTQPNTSGNMQSQVCHQDGIGRQRAISTESCASSNYFDNSTNSSDSISPWITSPPPNFQVPHNLVNKMKPWCSNNNLGSHSQNWFCKDSALPDEKHFADDDFTKTKYNRRFENQSNHRGFNNYNNSNNNNKSWFNEEINKEIEKKNFLLEKAKRSGHNEQAWEEFKLQRNLVGRLIQESKTRCGVFGNKREMQNNNVKKQKSYYCDTCDRAFDSETELQYHVDEHIKCGVAGCQFTAHPKIVALHRRMQHDTGYYKIINNAKNEEDIKKWVDERKKRFPTSENIAKRKAEQLEKEARGEVVINMDFGKFKKQKLNSDQESKRKSFPKNKKNRSRRSRRDRNYTNEHDNEKNDDNSDSSDDDLHIKLPKFLGISDTADKMRVESEIIKTESSKPQKIVDSDSTANPSTEDFESNNISENSFNEDVQNINEITSAFDNCKESQKPPQADVEKHALDKNNLLNDSVVELKNTNMTLEVVNISSDDEPTEIPILKKAPEEIPSVPGTSTILSNKDLDGSSSVKIANQNQHCPKGERNNCVKKSFEETDGTVSNKRKTENPITLPHKSSLLEKLLADDIRKERNLIMQCVRHIVQNNFYGIGQNN